jgi:ribokinase
MVGSSNTDLVARVPRMPRYGECLTGSTFSIGFGGKGANQAVMAARLGADVSVITRLGQDAFGEAYRRHYEEEGIDTTWVALDHERASGTTLILVEEGTGVNTMAYVPGANGALSAADLRASGAAITGADVLLCQLETPVAATLEAFRIARGAGDRRPVTVLNAAPVPVPPDPLPDELLELADIVVANEEESAYLAGVPVEDPDAATAVVGDLAVRWAVTVILTLGPRGVVLAAPAEPVRHLPVRSVQAVDTTGAGDAFVGSLAWLLATGTPVAEAVPRASQIATLTVLRPGTQASYPTRAEVAAELGW